MKNYPNQVSSLDRMRGALRTIQSLHSLARSDGRPGLMDPLDDGDFGYEAARRRIYTFRGLVDASDADIEARIKSDLAKPSGSQGARTFAREARRTLRDMGWIDAHAAVTDQGEDFLATTPASPEERAYLTKGLMNIAVTDDEGRVSHPVRIMLKLLAYKPSGARAGLELALEARDDSPEEYERIKRLYDLSPDERRKVHLISDTQRANAVKVFPSLARTAGLVVEGPGRLYSITPDGKSILNTVQNGSHEHIVSSQNAKKVMGHRVTSKSVAMKLPTAVPKALSVEEQVLARIRLHERTIDHQQLVKDMARFIGDESGSFYEDPFSFDLIWVPRGNGPLVLFEMKTVRDDESAQAVRALGQLAYYGHFKIPFTQRDRKLVKAAVFDRRIGDSMIDFLSREGIAVVTVLDGIALPLNSNAIDLVQHFLPG